MNFLENKIERIRKKSRLRKEWRNQLSDEAKQKENDDIMTEKCMKKQLVVGAITLFLSSICTYVFAIYALILANEISEKDIGMGIIETYGYILVKLFEYGFPHYILESLFALGSMILSWVFIIWLLYFFPMIMFSCFFYGSIAIVVDTITLKKAEFKIYFIKISSVLIILITSNYLVLMVPIHYTIATLFVFTIRVALLELEWDNEFRKWCILKKAENDG